MGDRMIDLSEEGARLSVRNALLVLEREAREPVTLPLAELGVLVVSQPRVRYSHAVLAGIAQSGGAFVACDEKHLPVGMLLPIDAHFVQAERFARQAEAALPVKKRLWKQIVQAKIRAQGRLLEALHGKDMGLLPMAGRVRSGDPDNLEAQASRRYWGALFDKPGFRRNRTAADANRNLNYGYAVLRAIVARAVCAAGLHPSLGLHHHNRYDAFCLADDLMEPFRPVVDGAVVRWVRERGEDAPFDREAKARLLEALTGRFEAEGESRTLFDLAARAASSLAGVFLGERTDLFLPEL